VEYIKRAYGVAIISFLIGWLTIPLPYTEAMSAAAGGISTLLIIGASIAWLTIRIRSRNLPSAINVIRFAILMGITILFPFGLVALASSGGTLSVIFTGSGYNWRPWMIHFLATVTLNALYLTLVELPYYLYRHVPRTKISSQALDLLPVWGSAIAALLAGILVILMHFAHGPLAGVSMAPLLVSAIAVATLLAPFFKWIIATIWRFGIIDTLSFQRWKETLVDVVNEVTSIANLKRLSEHARNCAECRAHFENCDECKELLVQHPDQVIREAGLASDQYSSGQVTN
jgi:hypothetical protein